MNKHQIRAVRSFSSFTIRYHWDEILRGAFKEPSLDRLKLKIRPHIMATLPSSTNREDIEAITIQAAKLARAEILAGLAIINRRLDELKAEITASKQ